MRYIDTPYSIERENYRLRRLHEQYCAETKPWIDLKLSVLNVSIPRMVVFKDGSIERMYDTSPDLQAFMDMADGELTKIRERYERAFERGAWLLR